MNLTAEPLTLVELNLLAAISVVEAEIATELVIKRAVLYFSRRKTSGCLSQHKHEKGS